MIIITGAAGFIGSSLASYLNRQGINDLLLVDSLDKSDKWKNLRQLSFSDYIDKTKLPEILPKFSNIQAILHMGACSATTERDSAYLMENNYRYTLELAEYCLTKRIQFIYASSAATYGGGELGYADDENQLPQLQPLNMYGYSKQLFDLKARRERWLEKIVGLKFFNVFGPNEYHKGDMASVVYKSFLQIRELHQVRLFKSYRPEYKDGEQLRDFIYIRDVVRVITFFLEHPEISGIFNVGTGQARSFKDLVSASFESLDLPANIEFIDMPGHLRDRYQYFTQADIRKLRSAGYADPFFTLEAAVRDYIQNYLANGLAHY
jgi:ADP-L-glycero-D-manno-heptose 6-epimerase